jgi:hypothetical protein
MSMVFSILGVAAIVFSVLFAISFLAMAIGETIELIKAKGDLY